MPITDLAKHQFIFICGLHRSGTSIIFKTLRDHPLISGFTDTGVPEDEGMHLQSVYPIPSGYHGGAGRFGFNPDEHLTETSPLLTPANRQLLQDEWCRYWDLKKPFLLEKSPPHLIKTRFLQAIFPQSYFIIVLRHPLAVSYATRKWYRYMKIFWIRLSTVLTHWLHCHELFLRDRPFLSNVMLLHYEKFVLNPSESMQSICDFLGIEHFLPGQTIKSAINERYFTMWERDRHSLLWQHSRNRLVEIYEERVRRFGYSLNDLEFLAEPVDTLSNRIP